MFWQEAASEEGVGSSMILLRRLGRKLLFSQTAWPDSEEPAEIFLSLTGVMPERQFPELQMLLHLWASVFSPSNGCHLLYPTTPQL